MKRNLSLIFVSVFAFLSFASIVYADHYNVWEKDGNEVSDSNYGECHPTASCGVTTGLRHKKQEWECKEKNGNKSDECSPKGSKEFRESNPTFDCVVPFVKCVPYEIICHHNPAQNITHEFANEQSYNGHLGTPHNGQTYDTDGACTSDHDPIACVWSDWSVCTQSCGEETQTRTHSVESNYGGASCIGDFSRSCNLPACYVPRCGNEKVDEGEQCDDGNTVSHDRCSATCQNETPVCNDEIANNYQSVDDGEYADMESCSYSSHRWCVLQDDESYIARAIPNNQENPTGKPWETGMDKNCEFQKEEPTPTPTATPNNGDVCANIEGIQLSLPDDSYHFDNDRKNCLQFSVPGAPTPPPAIGGAQVLGASTINGGGKVLGTSTMAKTGAVEDAIFNSIFTLGSLLTSFGIMKNGKKRA